LPSLKKLARDQLNDKALKLGIADAVEMDNRAAVIQAIEAKKAELEDRPDARVVSVFRNGLYVLVEMHVDRAVDVFGDLPIADAAGTEVIDATRAEIDEMRQRNPQVANSALAAAALSMAYELDHPFNSATAKSYCVKELRQTMDWLREQAPPKAKGGSRLEELRKEREAKEAAARRSAA
jgi:hypothetical protein